MGSHQGRGVVTDRWNRAVAMTIGAGAAAAVLGACGGQRAQTTAAGSSPGGSCQGSSGNAAATTSNYAVVLDVGPAEQMYSQQQVDATHPTSGEVMLGGEMADVSGPNVRHVEAHICSRSTGAVVTGAHPSISIADRTAGTPPQSIPVAEMQGVGQGVSDYHYGNDAALTPGHTYAITVRVNGEQAVLTYKVS